MIVSDFLLAQFLATKGTQQRIRMNILFCVVATVLCTDGIDSSPHLEMSQELAEGWLDRHNETGYQSY